MIVSPFARFILALLAVVLLVPVLGVPIQEVAVLEKFHNRKLRQWPASSSFASDPTQYFREAKAWLADRSFPIIQASTLEKKVLFYVLATPPQRRVTMGKNDFIFLNGASESDINGLFKLTCIHAHSEPVIKAFKDSLPALADFSRSRKITVDIVLLPTMASLYGDFLPASVPEVYRLACIERTNGRSRLVDLQQQVPVTLVYPLLEMKAARNDEGFFPKANWHADGLSLRVARDAYLRRLGVTAQVQDTIELREAPSEILMVYGIMKNYPVYQVYYPRLQENVDQAVALQKRIADLFNGGAVETRTFDNTEPVLPESVLVISDSSGYRASAVFAGAFQHLTWINTNDMDQTRLVELIDRTSQLVAVDRIIMMGIESCTDRIVTWSKALAAQ